ncbi:MAG: glycoside hydrolase family 16 protein [Pseudomonadota bacterium]
MSALRKLLTSPVLSLLAINLLIFPTVSNAGWERTWIDDFSGSGVNLGNWTPQIQANFNAEVQCYTDDDSSINKNYDVSGGTLKIIARRQAIACPGLGGQMRNWTSGRINSKDKAEFLYGRIETRIRFLNLEGGTWPAFWMLENRIAEDPIAGDNDNVNWPNPGAGEIDVWEWFGNGGSSYITNFYNTGGCGAEFRPPYSGGPSDVMDWHVYAIEWSADTISFFRDGTQVATHSVTTCPQYKEPMFVLLNVAMGGTLGGAIDPALTTATMEVDYVAHCTATASNSAQFCNESTPAAAGGGTGTFPDLILLTSDPINSPADLVQGVDYTQTTGFTSLSVFNSAFTGDPDYDPVFAVTSGNGYGPQVGQLAFEGFASGFTSSYDSLVFKAKGLNNDLIRVRFLSPDSAYVDIPLDTSGFSTPLGNGWYQVSIPLSQFGSAATATSLLFETDNLAGTSFTFLLTDAGFKIDTAGSGGSSGGSTAVDPASIGGGGGGSAGLPLLTVFIFLMMVAGVRRFRQQ